MERDGERDTRRIQGKKCGEIQSVEEPWSNWASSAAGYNILLAQDLGQLGQSD